METLNTNNDMPHAQLLQLAVNVVQWTFICIVGIAASELPEYKENIEQVAWTVLSMSAGTVVSYFIKKLLNRKRKK